jgi:hypothetical protein
MPAYLVTAKIEHTVRVDAPSEEEALRKTSLDMHERYGFVNDRSASREVIGLDAIQVDGGAVISNPALNQPFEDRFSRT